ncbi:PWWP domain-containing protein 2A [Gouania willdenowi]|uniref:PWWP domain-containing protein n=1 Tax=Gouania willdenowi TaxID=441366 RepID=A0A8C5HFB7_GOUWI|nr:PWWP domain-containing protein 2A [Gouania willdenowi]
MAAVTAEPGAAAVPTPTDTATESDKPPEPSTSGFDLPGVRIEPYSRRDSGREQLDGVDSESRHVDQTEEPDRALADRISARGEEYCSLPPNPQPSAVFLHSFPVPPPNTEAGLSLDEPAEPTTNGTTDLEREYRFRAPVNGDVMNRDLDPGTQESLLRSDSTPNQTPAEASPAAQKLVLKDLSPGTEVQVSLDHVIDDAVVVSFRFGDRIFSGVLMDVSRRFGPHGIPITVFPRRDDQSKPVLNVVDDLSIKDQASASSPSLPSSHTLKPPPLFQEGALYPPPLFIRDTYNQALPQPPPRKIKRPKRRYRCEEPTSIMNAIKLRPRQVLCDKCKGVVASGGRREVRLGSVDFRCEAVSRRQKVSGGSVSSEVKRLRSNDKDRCSSSSSSQRALRAKPASSRVHLNSKKALSKAVVRNSEPPQQKPKIRSLDDSRAVTRAAALENQKVHFTRRLQNCSGSAHSSNSATQLPPRTRLKPQRYRTDESQPQNNNSTSPRPLLPKPPLSPAHLTDPYSPPLSQPLAPAPSCELSGEETPCSVDEPLSQGGVGSYHSECSSTETFDPPSREPPSALVPRCQVSPAADAPPPRVDYEMMAAGCDEEEGDLKRRRKSSTSSTSSSSSSSSVFSKSVSKCLLPDGRTVCVGDIVWAKIYGFPWWPARVLGITVSRRGDTGLSVRQEARVSWFGSPTTSFLPLVQLSPFLETFQLRFDRKRKGPYRRAIAEAASAAKQLTPEVRALLTQFET